MFYEHLMDKKREIATIYNSISNDDKSKFDTYMLFTKVKDDFYVQVSDPMKTELKYIYNINNEEKLIIDIKFLHRLCGAANINLSYDNENYYFYMKLPYIPIFNSNVVKVKK